MKVSAHTVVAWFPEAESARAIAEFEDFLSSRVLISQFERHDEDMLERRDDPAFVKPPDSRAATWVIWGPALMRTVNTQRITEALEASPLVLDYEVHTEDMLERGE